MESIVTVESLFNAALTLSDEQRADLADRLLDTIPEVQSTPLHPAWRDIVSRRSAELDTGLVQPIPWDEVRQSAWDDVIRTNPYG